jgi:uncharacterized membrane protein
MLQRFFGRFRRRGSGQPGPRRGSFLYTHIPATVVAASVGLLVLLDLLTNIPFFNGVGALLVEYGLIIAAFALMLGVLNILLVHIRKVREQEDGWPYSVVLIGTTIALSVAGVWSGPTGSLISWTATYVLFPLQSAFFSLLAFFLLTVAYRAMRINSVESLLLVGSATLVILGATPLGSLISPLLVDVKAFLLAVPATAGSRGLLLGIALGTIVTGVRLVFDGRRYFK